MLIPKGFAIKEQDGDYTVLEKEHLLGTIEICCSGNLYSIQIRMKEDFLMPVCDRYILKEQWELDFLLEKSSRLNLFLS